MTLLQTNETEQIFFFNKFFLFLVDEHELIKMTPTLSRVPTILMTSVIFFFFMYVFFFIYFNICESFFPWIGNQIGMNYYVLFCVNKV